MNWLHSLDCLLFPVHSRPPFSGGGLVQVRLRYCVPPPQLSLHSVQLLQEAHWPSTEDEIDISLSVYVSCGWMFSRVMQYFDQPGVSMRGEVLGVTTQKYEARTGGTCGHTALPADYCWARTVGSRVFGTSSVPLLGTLPAGPAAGWPTSPGAPPWNCGDRQSSMLC